MKRIYVISIVSLSLVLFIMYSMCCNNDVMYIEPVGLWDYRIGNNFSLSNIDEVEQYIEQHNPKFVWVTMGNNINAYCVLRIQTKLQTRREKLGFEKFDYEFRAKILEF